jgi:hypothetical protein
LNGLFIKPVVNFVHSRPSYNFESWEMSTSIGRTGPTDST